MIAWNNNVLCSWEKSLVFRQQEHASRALHFSQLCLEAYGSLRKISTLSIMVLKISIWFICYKQAGAELGQPQLPTGISFYYF